MRRPIPQFLVPICVLATACYVLACPSAAQSPAATALSDLASASERQLDLAEVALLAAREVNPRADVDAYVARVDDLAARLRGRVGRGGSPEDALEAMAAFLYDDEGLGEPDRLSGVGYAGLDELLDKRRWNCFPMTVLYLTLGDRLGLPLRMVSGRGHCFVEWDSRPPLYAETTQQGRVHEDREFLRALLPYPCLDPDRYVALTKRQAAAVIVVQTALALQHARNIDGAMAFYRLALDFDPTQPDAYAGQGFIYAASGRLDEAVAAFRESIRLDPGFLEGYGGLGNALHAQGDLQGAVAAYRELVTRCPDEPRAVYNLAKLLVESGDGDGAIAAFERYVELEAGDPEGFYLLAAAREDAGDLDGALEACRRGMWLDRDNVDAYLNLGRIQERRGKYGDARTKYWKALQCDQGNPYADIGMARTSVALGEPEKALPRLNRAVERESVDPAVLISAAQVYRDMGRLDEARACARRASELGSRLPTELAGLVP